MELSSSLTESGYVAMLPNRRYWPVVCHREFLGCSECLRRIAVLMAREIGYNTQSALDRPAASYQAEVRGELEHGHELRRLTVRECFLANPDYSGFARGTTAEDVFVADDLEVAA